jgi:hypothetical protein
VAGVRAAVDMQNFACDERSPFKIKHGVSDFLRLSHSAHGL